MTGLDPAALATAALAFLVLAAAPGPATLSVAATAMASGLRAALALSAGLSLGLALWGLVAAAGLGALLAGSATAMAAARVLGGLYLLWLAWQSARAAIGPAPDPATGPRTADGRRLARRGFLLNATNPKAVLAWMAVLALGSAPGTGPAQLWAAALLCAGIGAGVYLGYALAFSRAPMRALYARARRWVEAGVALVFGLAGARLLAGRAADAP